MLPKFVFMWPELGSGFLIVEAELQMCSRVWSLACAVRVCETNKSYNNKCNKSVLLLSTKTVEHTAKFKFICKFHLTSRVNNIVLETLSNQRLI